MMEKLRRIQIGFDADKPAGLRAEHFSLVPDIDANIENRMHLVLRKQVTEEGAVGIDAASERKSYPLVQASFFPYFPH